jgi:hypothetical protein
MSSSVCARASWGDRANGLTQRIPQGAPAARTESNVGAGVEVSQSRLICMKFVVLFLGQYEDVAFGPDVHLYSKGS